MYYTIWCFIDLAQKIIINYFLTIAYFSLIACRAGFLLGGAGIFVLLMPWMDRNRERRLEEERKMAEQALTQDNAAEQENSKSITNKIEELNIKVSNPIS